jgi:hypothetical protein
VLTFADGIEKQFNLLNLITDNVISWMVNSLRVGFNVCGRKQKQLNMLNVITVNVISWKI